MSLELTPVHRNLHTRVTFLGLELEDLILVLALAALMNLLAHFVSDTASLRATWKLDRPRPKNRDGSRHSIAGLLLYRLRSRS
jgi:hypothetical protein